MYRCRVGNVYIYACGILGSQHRSGICGASTPAAAVVDTGESQGGAMMYSVRSSLDIFAECNLRGDPGGNNVIIAIVIRGGNRPVMLPLFTFQTNMGLMEITEKIYGVYPESPLAVIPVIPGEQWQMHGHREAPATAGGDSGRHSESHSGAASSTASGKASGTASGTAGGDRAGGNAGGKAGGKRCANAKGSVGEVDPR